MTNNTAHSQDLVSVIIPAYNAAVTIAQTLRSVSAQTYANIEILVVDDGSTDDTARIVEDYIAVDPRVRLFRQENGGVARARNRGIAEAKGDFVAPLDADDLWRCRKIEKQMETLLACGDKVGLVYTWFAQIDEHSAVIDANYRPHEEGDVLARMYRGNLIGNGSSALMRKSVVEEAGGYDATLRDRNAQGCEDLRLFVRIAEKYHFVLVPEVLTGYRQTQQNMSSDAMQMIRSWAMVSIEMAAKRPDLWSDLDKGRCSVLSWLYERAVHARQFRMAWSVWRYLAARHPRMAMKALFLPPIHRVHWWVRYKYDRLTGRRAIQAQVRNQPFLPQGACGAG